MKTKQEMLKLTQEYFLSLPMLNDEALNEFVIEVLSYFESQVQEIPTMKWKVK